MSFRSFRLQPPHALLFPNFASGRAGLATASPRRLAAVLRASLMNRRFTSRIRPNRVCVDARCRTSFLRTIRSLPVALHQPSRARSYFQLMAGSSAMKGLSPFCSRTLPSAQFQHRLGACLFRFTNMNWRRDAARTRRRGRLALRRRRVPTNPLSSFSLPV